MEKFFRTAAVFVLGALGFVLLTIGGTILSVKLGALVRVHAPLGWEVELGLLTTACVVAVVLAVFLAAVKTMTEG
jgi:hypothetical protein